MALLFVESFDHWTTGTHGVRKGWVTGRTPSASGRFGNGMDSGSRTDSFVLPSNYATLIMGEAYRYQAVNDGAQLMGFYDGATKHVYVEYVVSTQTFHVRRGDGTSLGSIFLPLVNGQWYYLEFKATINDTTGVVELRKDGTAIIGPLTSQDTRNGGNSTANKFFWGTDNGGANASGSFDDIYICDDSGSAPTNTFLGDCRIEALFPNGNGATSNLVGSDGNSTDNYLLVDETTPNDDTDYVESGTAGDKDTYTYTNLTPTAGTVYGVQILPYVRKTDAGARSIKSIARHSGTEVDGPEQVLGTSFVYARDIREAKPGGGAWSISDVNGAEFGVKVFA